MFRLQWGCGAAHHFEEFPNDSIVGGLPITVKWEGGEQVVDEVCQFVHSIGVYTQSEQQDHKMGYADETKMLQLARIRDGRAKRLSYFFRQGLVEFINGQVGIVEINDNGEESLNPAISRIRRGDKAARARVEGLKISGSISTAWRRVRRNKMNFYWHVVQAVVHGDARKPSC